MTRRLSDLFRARHINDDAMPSDVQDAVSEGVRTTLDALQRQQPSLGSVSVSVALSGVTKFAHGLTETPNRWRIVDVDADTRIYRSGTWDSKFAQLTTVNAANVIVELWRVE